MKISKLAVLGAGVLLVMGFTRLSMADTPKTDGEIIGLVSAVDKSEIAAAHQAEGKNISPDVMDFAKMMDKDHSDNLAKLNDLAGKTGIQAPATTGAMIIAKGDKDATVRSVMSGHDFEKAYINDMVTGHTDALNLIDSQLMPSVQNPDLKSFLAATRDRVAEHLAKAKQLQSKMQTAA